ARVDGGRARMIGRSLALLDDEAGGAAPAEIGRQRKADRAAADDQDRGLDDRGRHSPGLPPPLPGGSIAALALATASGGALMVSFTIRATRSPLMGFMSRLNCLASARKPSSFMVASNALRSA